MKTAAKKIVKKNEAKPKVKSGGPARLVRDDKKIVGEMMSILAKTYPDAKTALSHDNPLELLVATILSAQCTDERVNIVTPILFKKYKTAAEYAAADPEELKEIIHSTGFFNNKTKNIIGMAKRLSEDFGGKVPETMAEMLTLPGVARKTANVVLGSAFGKIEGIVVDTHVLRVSHRLGLSRYPENADKAEQDLMEIIPKKDWIWFSHSLVWHGRKICQAKKPDCQGCPLNKLCPSAFTFAK